MKALHAVERDVTDLVVRLHYLAGLEQDPAVARRVRGAADGLSDVALVLREAAQPVRETASVS